MIHTVVDEPDYEQAVALHHEPLFRFAFSLAGNPDDASELTQEAYCRLLSKGGQLRDASKVKSWLFTTLYRAFLGRRRHQSRFPHLDLETAEDELPAITPTQVGQMDGALAMEALTEVDELYRVPLALFYLQSLSYREIAELLDVPIGTVMSRLSRGKALLRERFAARRAPESASRIVPLSPRRSAQSE